MTARHNHPGTATPQGGASAPSGSGSSVAAPAGTIQQALQPIGGLPGELEQLSAAYLAGAEQFRTAHSKVKSIHNTVFIHWAGAASREGERATRMAVGRAQYALDALHNTSQALKVFALKLADAQGRQILAAGQINTLLPLHTADPTNATLIQEINTQAGRAIQAQQDAANGRRVVEAALVHSSTVIWYRPAGLDPIDAAIIDSLVAHHKMTPGNANLVAGRLHNLSPTNRKKFARLEATATSDQERAKLYNELAKGTHVSQIAASVGASSAPAHAHHSSLPLAPSGGVAASSGASSTPVAAAVAPAVAGRGVAQRPSGSGSPGRRHKHSSSKPSAPKEAKGWHPFMKPGYHPPTPAPAPKHTGAFSTNLTPQGPTFKPVPPGPHHFTTPAPVQHPAPTPAPHAAAGHNLAPSAFDKPAASNLRSA
jgi:hypothetical protein